MREYSISIKGISAILPQGSLENELTAKLVTKKKQYGGKNHGRFLEVTEDAPVFVRDNGQLRAGLGAILFLSKQNPFIDIGFSSFSPERWPLDEIIIPEGIKNSPKWTVNGKERFYFHEALYACQKNYCGTVKLPTGSGKTPIQLTLAYNQVREIGTGLILVPTLTIRDQFMKDAQSFGIEVRGYREWLYDLEYGKQCSILITTPGVVSNDIGSDDPIVRTKHDEIKFIIADEAHHAGCDTWNKLFMDLPNLQRSHGFSALPVEEHNECAISFQTMNYEDALTISAVGPIIYQRSTKELKDFLNIPTLINIPYEWQETIMEDYTSARKLIKNELNRSRLIADIMAWLCQRGYICITHVHEKEHADNIMQFCGTGKVVVWKGGGKVYNDLTTYSVDELREIIGKEVFGLVCTRHAVEGLNLEGIPINVTILSEERKPRATVQKTGRAVRPGVLPSVVINIQDKNVSILPKHSSERAYAIAEEFDSDLFSVKNLMELKEVINQLEFM